MLCQEKFDIICLTEIKISKANKNFYFHKDYDTYLNLPPEHQQNTPKEGVATLIRKELNVGENDISFLVKGRATHIKLKLNKENLNAYACMPLPKVTLSPQSFLKTFLIHSLTPVIMKI